VEEVLKKHPKLRFTLAHFGFLSYDIDRAKRWLDGYEYTAFDTTPGDEQYLEMLKDWGAWSRFFEAYQDRIIYGSDFYPFQNRRPQFVRQFFETEGDFTFLGKPFRGVAMDGKILEKIYFDNMQKRMGEPKKIDFAYMRDKAEALQNADWEKRTCTEGDIRLILETV
jgi:predicted TIM-barrel fold metal-dependent hydrolase